MTNKSTGPIIEVQLWKICFLIFITSNSIRLSYNKFANRGAQVSYQSHQPTRHTSTPSLNAFIIYANQKLTLIHFKYQPTYYHSHTTPRTRPQPRTTSHPTRHTSQTALSYSESDYHHAFSLFLFAFFILVL